MRSFDVELVQRVLRGDPVAIDAVVLRLHCIPRFLARLDRRAGGVLGREDLRDLSQDSFVAVWARLGSYTGEASLVTWTHGFCVNGFRNAVRRKARFQATKIESHPLPGRAPDPSEACRHEHLHTNLGLIDARDARVIRLRCFEELTFEETGAGLGLSPNTAKTCYYRGLRRLAELLRGQPGEV